MNSKYIFSSLIPTLVILLASLLYTQAQTTNPVQVLVSLDKPDWNYEPGEEASFSIQVAAEGVSFDDMDVVYTLGPERMTPDQSGRLSLIDGQASVTGALNQPGFLRCEVRVTAGGKTYKGLATAAYAPESIQPTQVMPSDFWEFWETAKAQAAEIPLVAKLELLPDHSTDEVDVYQLSIQHHQKGSRLYGILAKPKKPGKYPAVLKVPGAGARPYKGLVKLAEEGLVTLEIGIHGIPVTYEKDLYEDLRGSALRGYQYANLDDRNRYYYKRVYLGCVRAVDYLCSLPEVDTSKLAVWGGSQGGALAIVTAALDDRVNYLVSLYPALCDLTGYQHGRAGGWPHLFHASRTPFTISEEKINASAYYDVVNFARSLTIPGLYTWGYNDLTCPPTSFYAAYNQIEAPKEVFVVKDAGHRSVSTQHAKIKKWLLARLKQN